MHKVLVGNIDCNIAASGALITVKGKWRLKCSRLGQDVQDPFLGLLDLQTLLPATSTYKDM
jgi:hypothetical protein